MATFNVQYYNITQVSRQKAGFEMTLGGGYTSTAAPAYEPRKRLTVSIEGMRYYFDESGDVLLTGNASTNIKVFEQFYLDHLQWKYFDFVTESYGTLSCRFVEPVIIPAVFEGGSGILQPFEVLLEEHA